MGCLVKHKDPITGDELTTGEWVSLQLQGVLRRWWFLFGINLAVLLVWVVVDPIWHHSPADITNYLLSLLAIDIEGVVGMFFFRQSIRDAKVIREIRDDDKRILKDVEAK